MLVDMERASMYVVWSCSFIFDLGNPDNVIMVSNCNNEGGGVGEGVGFLLGFGEGFAEGFGEGFGEGFAEGFAEGFGEGFAEGFGEGFGLGFGEGFAEGSIVGAIVDDSEYLLWVDETCAYDVIIDKYEFFS